MTFFRSGTAGWQSRHAVLGSLFLVGAYLRLFRFTVAGLMLLAGCGKNAAEIWSHSQVDARVAQSLAATPQTADALSIALPETFSFAMFSDVHIEPDNKTTLFSFKNDVAARGISFFAVLGDLSEDGTIDEFNKVSADLNAVGVPYYTTVGNHDLFQPDNAGGWSYWLNYFGPATYAITINNAVRLIFLDTSTSEVGQLQFDWLQAQLEQSELPTIVGSHYPIYDGADPSIWRISSEEERFKLTNLLNAHNVKAYVAGHMHGYRENKLGNLNHFIVGSMFPYVLDEGTRGYLLFTFDHGDLRWEKVGIDF